MSTQIRLRAAILATTVEMSLMNRIDSHLALMAADQVFEILHTALIDRPELSQMIRAGQPLLPIPSETTEPYASALDCIDEANLLLFACREATDLAYRTIRAREAVERFDYAMTLLQQVKHQLDDGEAWEYWYREAKAGHHLATSFLGGTNQ